MSNVEWRKAKSEKRMMRVGLAFAAFALLLAVSSAESEEAVAERKASDLEIRIFRIAYISPNLPCPNLSDESLLDVLKTMRGPRGSIDFERRANALIVRDAKENLDAMQQLVELTDLPPKSSEAAPNAGKPKNCAGPDSVISLETTERSLKQILDYLSEVSGKTITTSKAKDQKLLVTIHVKNATYRAVLAVIAHKYGMAIDNSQFKDNTIVLSMPEQVSMVVYHADIRDVINSLSIQSDTKIVIGPEVTGEVTMKFERTPWREALDTVARQLDFVVVPEVGGTLRITSPYKMTSFHAAAEQLSLTDELRKSAAPDIAAYGGKIVISHTLEIGQRIEGTLLLRNEGDKHLVKMELTIVIPIKDQEKPFEQRLVFSEKEWSYTDVPVLLHRIDMPAPTENAEPEFRITYLQFAK